MKNQVVRRLCKYTGLFYFGGSAYLTIEIFFRGYTHISMFFVGAIAFLLIGGINHWLPWRMGLIYQCLIGAAAVTVVELVAGCVLNLWLGLGIWDYAALPLNLLGQICLQYSLAWIVLSAVGILLDDYLRWKLFGDERPRYTLL